MNKEDLIFGIFLLIILIGGLFLCYFGGREDMLKKLCEKSKYDFCQVVKGSTKYELPDNF